MWMHVVVACVIAVVAVGVVEAKTVPASSVTVDTRACLPPHDKYAFCNTSLSIDERVKNLISLLHDDEKPPLLTAREGGGGSPGPPGNVSRIGLPEYDWGVNCIHGVQSKSNVCLRLCVCALVCVCVCVCVCACACVCDCVRMGDLWRG